MVSDGLFNFCNQQGSSDGAEDAFVLHFLYLVAGQAFRGQGAFYAEDCFPSRF